MKQKYQISSSEAEAMSILVDEVDPRDLFILGYLRGFNRRNMRKWQEQGLCGFSVEYPY